MKEAIVLVMFVGGLNQCGFSAEPNKVVQEYTSMEECQDVAKRLITLDEVRSAKCIKTVNIDAQDQHQ